MNHDDTFLTDARIYHAGAGFAFDSASPHGRPSHITLDNVFCVRMTPEVFLSLAPPLDMHAEVRWVSRHLDAGGSMHPACLAVDFYPDYGLDSLPEIVAHDGRHRMTALAMMGLREVEVPVLVSISFPLQHLADMQIVNFRTGAWSQRSEFNDRHLVSGPLFGEAVAPGRRLSDDVDGDVLPFLRR